MSSVSHILENAIVNAKKHTYYFHYLTDFRNILTAMFIGTVKESVIIFIEVQKYKKMIVLTS